MSGIRAILPLFTAVTILLSAVSGSSYASELIDGIEAVVGNYIILKSEVAFQVQLWAMQQNRGELSPGELEKVRAELVEQMVDDKLILIRALKDTSINVSSEEIEEALDYRLEELKSRFPSQGDFERQMALEGLTYRELKNKFREEMRNKLYKDRLISRELSKISILPSEVRSFFEVYKDSLPAHPEIVKLAHILLNVEPSQATLDSARARAARVRDLLDGGADFAQLAEQYSDDPSASNGGDIGYFSRGDLVEEFEAAAFGLDIGEISDIVQTQYGFHIIKCEDKLGDRVRCRHILCMTSVSDEDRAATIRLADSLKTEAERGHDFAELVKQYSIDEETKKQGGELDWFVYSEMTPDFKAAVEGLEVGDISSPTESQFGIHILKLLDRQRSRPWSLEQDMDRLKELVRRQKTEMIVGRLVEDLKREIYVEVRDQ
jgi:peptidyl-prolyl cis-trans isomerase SurA